MDVQSKKGVAPHLFEPGTSISSVLELCTCLFTTLISTLSSQDSPTQLISSLQEELGRLRVWAGNLGAQRVANDEQSLEYSLKHAPELRREVIDHFHDLGEAIQEATSIASGEEIQFATNTSDSENEISNPGLVSAREELKHADADYHELEEYLKDIRHTVTSLYRFANTLENPASDDRVWGSADVRPCVANSPNFWDIGGTALAIITAAVQSTKSLYDAVSRYRGRDKTLGRLQVELQDLTKILDALKQVVDVEASVLELLHGPIDRCSKICGEFEQSMDSFWRKSRTGNRDWAKMEFMRGDINEFTNVISSYRSTISVGLGTINMHTANVSQNVLKQYKEMIQDTAYNLEVHLQRVDGKLERFNIDNKTISDSAIGLSDEQEVAKQCLRVCEDARHYIRSLESREFPLLQNRPQEVTKDSEPSHTEAQLLIRQALNENRDNFSVTITQLQDRLESLVLKNDPNDEKERSRLQEDINTSKQCLEVCEAAREVSCQKVYGTGEVIADNDSDQVVVTTLADLFDIKKAVSKGKAAQLGKSMTEEAFEHLIERRYSSRFE